MPSLSPTASLSTAPSLSRASSATPSPALVSRTDVLLIDDSVADLRLLMELMTLRDLRLSVALDAERGYQQALLLRPGLILLDVHMPGMDGFSLCRRLKAEASLRSIPVIFLTAATDLAERLEGFAVGGVDYIAKPFEEQEVVARVGVHLQRAAPRVSPPDEYLPPGTEASAAEDRTREAILVAGAQQLLRDTLANPPELERLARLLGTNRRQLNDAFQARCGQPVFGWLRDERLRQAHALVSQTTTPFTQIGERLGYSSAANFAKAFRLRYGCAPSELRARLQALCAPE